MRLEMFFRPYTLLAIIYDLFVVGLTFVGFIDVTIKIVGLCLASLVAWFTISRLKAEIRVNRLREANEELLKKQNEEHLKKMVLENQTKAKKKK
jgi:hypothetical protein